MEFVNSEIKYKMRVNSDSTLLMNHEIGIIVVDVSRDLKEMIKISYVMHSTA